MECGRIQKPCHVIAGPSNFINAGTDISRKLPEVTGHMSSCADSKEEKEEEDHARLPTQMPASRVFRNPGGNNRQERMDAVSGLKDGKHRADNP